MRQQAKGALLAFLREQTEATYARLESYEDELMTYFAAVPSSGVPVDAEIATALAAANDAQGSPEADELFDRFHRRFLELAEVGDTDDVVPTPSDGVSQLDADDLQFVRDLHDPPKPPPLPGRMLH